MIGHCSRKDFFINKPSESELLNPFLLDEDNFRLELEKRYNSSEN